MKCNTDLLARRLIQGTRMFSQIRVKSNVAQSARSFGHIDTVSCFLEVRVQGVEQTISNTVSQIIQRGTFPIFAEMLLALQALLHDRYQHILQHKG